MYCPPLRLEKNADFEFNIFEAFAPVSSSFSQGIQRSRMRDKEINILIYTTNMEIQIELIKG